METDGDNPKTLSSAYFLATQMGWESTSEVTDWFYKAANLSRDDGPVQKASLSQLNEHITEWRNEEDYILGLFNDMKAPALAVSGYLNRSLNSFYLIPAFLNISSNDLRFEQPIPAFTSYRPITGKVPKNVALDVTSILNLGFMNKLGQVINYFEQITIPHSLMFWLYREVKNAAYHQPSRIERAKEVRNFIADNLITVSSTRIPKSIELGLEVGDELAALCDEAIDLEKDKPCLVVCSMPITKAGSYLEELADITQVEHLIVECNHVVKSMRLHGYISESEEIDALSFLQTREEFEETSIELNEGINLYLNSLSISYFQTIGLLDKLVYSSFNIFIHISESERCRKLVSLEGMYKKVSGCLKEIADILGEGFIIVIRTSRLLRTAKI